MTHIHLICLREPDEAVTNAIKSLWPDHYELNGTQLLIKYRLNGGPSVYDKIEKKIGRDFAALIVRFEHAYHGRHSSTLWDWLRNHG